MRGRLGAGTGIAIELDVDPEHRGRYAVTVGEQTHRLADTTRPQGFDLPAGSYLVRVASRRGWDASNALTVDVAPGRRVDLTVTSTLRPGWAQRAGAATETLRLAFTDDLPASAPPPSTSSSTSPIAALSGRPTAPTAPPDGALAHVELWTSNLSEVGESFGWLFGELGWVPEDVRGRPAGYVWRHADGSRVRLAESAESGSRHDRFRPGLNHLAVRVADPGRRRALRDAAARHGWSVLDPDDEVRLENAQGFAVHLVGR